MPVSLDPASAAASDRVRRKIGLAQSSLAKEAEVAQGTISNFFQGKSVRNDFARRILEVLEDHVKKDSPSSRDLRTAADIILRARKRLSARTAEDRFVSDPDHVAWEPSDFFMLLMRLTDKPRLNLTKAFDYQNEEHFRAHAECVLRGVPYDWIAYRSDSLRAEWNDYLSDLRVLLLEKNSDRARDERQDSYREKDVDTRLRDQIRCHAIPKALELRTPPIPFRITLFGDDVCLCSEEREKREYQYGGRYFVLDAEELRDLRVALRSLFDACPAIDSQAEGGADALNLCRKSHDSVRSAFLKVLLRRSKPS